MAEVAGESDESHPRVSALELGDDAHRAIAAPVIDKNDLKGSNRGQGSVHPVVEDRKILLFVEHRNDNRDPGPSAGTPGFEPVESTVRVQSRRREGHAVFFDVAGERTPGSLAGATRNGQMRPVPRASASVSPSSRRFVGVTSGPSVGMHPGLQQCGFIEEAIRSVLSQTFDDFELVVDDASRDDTAAVVESFRDGRIRLFRNDENFGAGRNWNRAIGLAHGRFVKVAVRRRLAATRLSGGSRPASSRAIPMSAWSPGKGRHRPKRTIVAGEAWSA